MSLRLISLDAGHELCAVRLSLSVHNEVIGTDCRDRLASGNQVFFARLSRLAAAEPFRLFSGSCF